MPRIPSGHLCDTSGMQGSSQHDKSLEISSRYEVLPCYYSCGVVHEKSGSLEAGARHVLFRVQKSCPRASKVLAHFHDYIDHFAVPKVASLIIIESCSAFWAESDVYTVRKVLRLLSQKA